MTSHEKSWDEFIALCAETTDKNDMEQCLTFFLTPEEHEMIASRILITQALLKGELSQRDIAKKTGVSIATITRGSNELKRSTSRFKTFLTSKLL